MPGGTFSSNPILRACFMVCYSTSSRGHRLGHWAGRRRGRAQIHFEALSGDLLGMNNEVTTQSRLRFQRSQLRHLLAEDARPHARFEH
jgi:hypothetical protein